MLCTNWMPETDLELVTHTKKKPVASSNSVVSGIFIQGYPG